MKRKAINSGRNKGKLHLIGLLVLGRIVALLYISLNLNTFLTVSVCFTGLLANALAKQAVYLILWNTQRENFLKIGCNKAQVLHCIFARFAISSTVVQ